MIFGRSRLPLKSSAELVAMRRAGLVTGSALCAAALGAKPGVTTRQLDTIAHEYMLEQEAIPSFLGYNGFPATLCISVNDEVVHGIPGERVIEDGDVVSLDCGAVVEGWHGDSALTFIAGVEQGDSASVARVVARHVGDEAALTPSDVAQAANLSQAHALVLATELSMGAGLRALRQGERLNVVGDAVQDTLDVVLDSAAPLAQAMPDFEIVDGYTGHGVGRELHQEPTVYNEHVRERLARARLGLVIAVEPMVTLGTYETHELDDGWTVKTDDGSLAAHFEHTIAVTEGGLWVLTAADGGRAVLGELFSPL